MFVVGRALSYGRGTALASVAGHSIGSYLAAASVALGLGPLLQRSALLLESITWAGACYLALGVHAVRHAGQTSARLTGTQEAQRPWRSIRTGVLVGLSNPKSLSSSR